MPKKQQAEESQSFEDSLKELENIVTQMENDQLPLEDLINHYERGASLLAKCESTLETAKKRLETIAKGEKSSPAKPSSSSKNTPSSDDDEIRLF